MGLQDESDRTGLLPHQQQQQHHYQQHNQQPQPVMGAPIQQGQYVQHHPQQVYAVPLQYSHGGAIAMPAGAQIVMVNHAAPYVRDDTCPAVVIFILGFIFPPVWFGGFCFLRSRTTVAKVLGCISACAAVVTTAALIVVCVLAAVHGPGFETRTAYTQLNWTQYGSCPTCTGGAAYCLNYHTSPVVTGNSTTCCSYYSGTCCTSQVCNSKYDYSQAAQLQFSSIPQGCMDSFGLLDCAACSPYAGNFFAPVNSANAGTKPKVCTTFCQRLYGECVNATISSGAGAGQKVGDFYGKSYQNFCQSIPGALQIVGGAENADCFNSAPSTRSNVWLMVVAAIAAMIFSAVFV